MTELQNATDNRLLIVVGIERVEKTPFNIVVAHNGKEIIDELIFPYSYGAAHTMRKVIELTEIYSKYASLVELQTDDRELIRLAVNMAGVHVRPKRRVDIQHFTQRTLEAHTEDNGIYELYDVQPLEAPKQLSKQRLFALSAVLKAVDALFYLTKKLRGER
jgi:hypothetical protein